MQLTWARKLNASAITRPPTAPRPPQIYLCLELEPLKPILVPTKPLVDRSDPFISFPAQRPSP